VRRLKSSLDVFILAALDLLAARCHHKAASLVEDSPTRAALRLSLHLTWCERESFRFSR
jgi:hypothetical protein